MVSKASSPAQQPLPSNPRTVHMVLQGKGGVGKSAIAAILAQYKRHKGQDVVCVDTDPVNATFTGYEALAVKRLEIMRGDEIDTRAFDGLVELIAQSPSDVVIDNGASSFVPLSHYLISNQVPQLLQTLGVRLTIHTVITGGQALLDTLNGFSQLVIQFPAECASFIVWLNPYFGEIRQDSKSFEQMKTYTAHRDRISAVVTIPTLKGETYGRDFAELLQSKRTFEQAIPDATLTLMERQRLTIIRQQLFSQLDTIPVL